MSKTNLPKATVPSRTGVSSEISERALNRWNPDVRAASEDGEATISILDPIGADWFGDGVTAKGISAALRNIGDKDVVVSINSPGGDFFEGLAIYNLLREHPGKVTVKVLGMAASAASVIAMAGNEILMSRASFMMIHNTWVLAAGDQHALRDVADWLAPFDEAAISIYHAQTGIGEKELANMLNKETWLGGTAAVDQGFADGFLASDEVEVDPKNTVELSPSAALKKLDVILASGNRCTKSEARQLVASIKGGKSGAALTGMSGAAVEGLVKGLEHIKTI